MSKYTQLSFHLASLGDSVWHATFDDVSQVLGFPLPSSAYAYPAWWANQSGPGHTQSTAWQSAGWKTTDLNLKGRTVTFVYDGGVPTSKESVEERACQSKGLTIAEAKVGLATYFGVSEDQIEITIRG